VSHGIENDDDFLIKDKLQLAYAAAPARAKSTRVTACPSETLNL
jgi:hypothetical protein